VSDMPKLPRGVYYEARRKRYRVRLYKGNRVVHRSYHKTAEDAVQTWTKARGTQQTVVVPRPEHYDLADPEGQISAIRSGAIE